MIEQGQKGGVCRHKSQITKKVKKGTFHYSGHEHKSYSLTHADGTAHEQ